MDETNLKLAACRVDISPPLPIRLAGFADRVGPYERQIDPIEAQLILLEQGDERVMLVGADLLWWSPELVDRLNQRLATVVGSSCERVILTATHSHSGPATGSNFLPSLETPDMDYVSYLEEVLIASAVDLPGRLRAIEARLWQMEINMNVNRRLPVNGQIVMAPNFAVSIDHRATVLRFSDLENESFVHLIHYPCHANVSAENSLHGDYPGVLLKQFQEAYPGSVNVFLQGATADIRPLVVIGDRFAKMGYEQAETYGRRLGEQLLALLCHEGGKEQRANLGLRNVHTALDLDPKYSVAELEEKMSTGDLEGEDLIWAQKIMAYPAYSKRNLVAKRLDLVEDFSLLSMNAEVVEAYARYAGSLDPTVYTIGYTDGMIGYVCTAEQIAEGGYEPDESGYWFTLSGPFNKSIEQKIKETIAQLCPPNKDSKQMSEV